MSAGAYIRIKDGNIELHAPGIIDFKAAKFPHAEPTELINHLPILPKSNGTYNVSIQLVDKLNQPYIKKAYFAVSESGQRFEGVTDEKGFTRRIYTNKKENISFHLLENHDYRDDFYNNKNGNGKNK